MDRDDTPAVPIIRATKIEVRETVVTLSLDVDTATHFMEALGYQGDEEDTRLFGSPAAGTRVYDALYEAIYGED